MGGAMSRILNKVFRVIDKPWKMYPLGFDTATEVALLGITSVEAAEGTSFWLLLIFPLLFTSGMCLNGKFISPEIGLVLLTFGNQIQ
jgi:nickel/cobalt transporter (NiCoT) family protein